jgi:hypothetical protein
MYVFLYDPLAEANGNDEYGLVLMIFIHCRLIYGTGTEAKNEALAKTLLFPIPLGSIAPISFNKK